MGPVKVIAREREMEETKTEKATVICKETEVTKKETGKLVKFHLI